MTWIVGLAASVGFAWLMYSNERFRRFGSGLIVLVVVGFAILWLTTENSNRQFEVERQRALSAISASQLTLTNLRLQQDSYAWRVSGTVLNRSTIPIRSLTLTIFLLECPSRTTNEGCIITGEGDARFYVDVPAGQARRLDTSVQLEDAASLGSDWSWQYGVKEIEADLSGQ